MNDSYWIPVFLALGILIPMLMFFVTVFVIISKNRQRRSENQRKEMEHMYEKQMLHTMIEVQENSMNRISQEIHDNIGQRLTGVHANLIMLSGELVADKEGLIAATKLQVSDALKDLRNVSHVLNSQYINNIGLEESLTKELEYLGAYTKIDFSFQVIDDVEMTLSTEKELTLFRIIQEALSNIVKHADATRVNIILQYRSKEFTVDIFDNGSGFDTNGKMEGLGLISMKQRTELLQGTLQIDSADGGGTRIKITAPY